MSRFLTLSYYFTPFPESNFQYSKATLLFCLLLFAAGIGLYFYRKKGTQDVILKKILRPYPGLLMIYSLVAFALLFFREMSLPYLSMRLWWLVLLGFLLYSGIKFALNFNREYSSRKQQHEKRQAKNKYLPKKKS